MFSPGHCEEPGRGWCAHFIDQEAKPLQRAWDQIMQLLRGRARRMHSPDSEAAEFPPSHISAISNFRGAGDLEVLTLKHLVEGAFLA